MRALIDLSLLDGFNRPAFAAVLAAVALGWGALWLTAQDLWRRRGGIDALDLALPALLFLAALALRWWLPVHALLWEDHHGYSLSPYLPLTDGVTPYGVVSAHVVLAKLYYYPSPLGREPFFE